jgi:type II secretory pathway pseudopilin PulG
VIVGIIAVVATPSAGKLIRRARDLSAMSTLTRELSRARILAIQRGFNVCVRVSTGSPDPTNPSLGSVIQLLTWEDRNPDFAPGTYTDTLGATVDESVFTVGNTAVPSSTNPLPRVPIGATLHLGKQPSGTVDDVATNVLFNGYTGFNSATAVIAFTPTGGIVPPIGSGCGLPTLTDGRGIYFQDAAAKNFFRITVPSNFTGKPRQEMWVVDGYRPANWVWQ